MTDLAAAKEMHRMMMQAIGFAGQILTPHADAMAALIEVERSMHSYLHITDPTLYIKAINDKGLPVQLDLCRAALAFVLAVQKAKSDAGVGDHA